MAGRASHAIPRTGDDARPNTHGRHRLFSFRDFSLSCQRWPTALFPLLFADSGSAPFGIVHHRQDSERGRRVPVGLPVALKSSRLTWHEGPSTATMLTALRVWAVDLLNPGMRTSDIILQCRPRGGPAVSPRVTRPTARFIEYNIALCASGAQSVVL
jgi:hypothetical protein